MSAAVTRRDSAHVEILTNGAPDRSLKWSVDSVLDVRSPSEKGADTVGFLDVWDVAVTRGRIIVLDGSQPGVFVYDTLGHLQGRYGRKGKGPGELSSPTAVTVLPHGSVAVVDLANRRVERFDSSFRATGSSPLGDLYFAGGQVRFSGGALILPVQRSGVDATFSDLIALRSTDTTVVATLRRPAGKMIYLKSCGVEGNMWPIFTPTLRWGVDPNGNVLVADGDTYDVDVYSSVGFALARRIRRTLPPIQGTEARAVSSLGQGTWVVTPNGQRMTCDPDETVAQRGFAKAIPPVTGIKVSPTGEIWVGRWVRKGTPPLVDVFDSTGVYLGSLTNVQMPVAFLGHHRVIVQRKDTMDVPFLTIYRVVR